jgi:VCBS repeat protein/FG-GAP repeat protein
VRVAVGDVNGDGEADVIVGAGSGGGPHIKIFDGEDGTLIREFFAFDASFHGGLFVAAGDINGDGFDDVIVGAGDSGGPHVRVFSGADGTILRELFAFDAGFRGGVRVASGDVNGDGFDDIIVGAGIGGGPHVKVISGADGTLLNQFFAFNAGFRGGVFVSSLDADDDGDDDIVTSAGEGGGPHVIIRDGNSLAIMKSFFAFEEGFRGGVRVATADVNDDGVPDLVVSAGQGNNSPRFRVFNVDDESELEDEFAFDQSFKGGVFVGGM